MREQDLIDMCFSIMMLVTDPQYSQHFSAMPMEEKAAWVTRQLHSVGFDVSPCGSSWGVLNLQKCQAFLEITEPVREN